MTLRCDKITYWIYLGAIATLTALLSGPRAEAQYLYLDADGDGRATASDQVRMDGDHTVEVWLQTDTGPDGSPARASADRSLLTINSYEFILQAQGGKVQFGEYTNLQPTMDLPLTQGRSSTEIHVGFAGSEILPPGKYHLGTLHYRVTEGTPSLSFASSSTLDGTFGTSFGSRYEGLDGDNTLKLGVSSGAATRTKQPAASGDWSDASGLSADADAVSKAAAANSPPTARFGAAIVRRQNGALALRVSTTRPGAYVVRVFDVRGRLVQSLQGNPEPSSQEFELGIGSRGHAIAAGVYFYRLSAPEGKLEGRFVLMK